MNKSDLRLALNSVRHRVRSLLIRNGGSAVRAFHTLTTRSYSREMRAVFSGSRAYLQNEAAAGSRYKLRRYVHMLEKGLSMQPRRDSFAVDYIEDALEEYSKSSLKASSKLEVDWFHAVFSDYFEATAASSSPRIQRARETFRSQGGAVSRSLHVPFPVGPVPVVVDIDEFSALAVQRKSVRWYRDEAVDRSKVDRAVAIALQSPTACNRIPWVLRIFDTTPEIRRVSKIVMGTTGFAHQLRGLAVLVGDLSAFVNEHDRHLIYIDGSLAAMSFVLGLQAQGISSCCINWPDVPERERAMAAELGLEPWQRVIMLIAFGYADPSGLTPYSAKVELDSVRRFG